MGTNGRVDQASRVTDAAGEVSAVWVLGTLATEAQSLGVRVQAGNHAAAATLTAIAKPVEVASIAFGQDTTVVKLGVATPLTVRATDPFGNQFVPSATRFISLDTTLCTVDSVGMVQARKRGFGRVVVRASSSADTAWVHPTQVVQAIIASPDTLRFHSLGQTVPLTVQLVDELGHAIGDSLPADSVVVDTVVKVQRGSTYVVRSVANGTTPVILRAGMVAQEVQVVVSQRVASVKVSASRTTFDALGDTVQLGTRLADSLGVPLTNEVMTYSSRDTSVAKVSQLGVVTSSGNGATWVYARALNGLADSLSIVVAQQVTRVAVTRDSIVFDALQAILPIQAAPIDRLGSPVPNAVLTYVTGAESVATVDADGNIRAVANGSTVVTAKSGHDSALVAVRVAQRAVRVLSSSDTIRFVAVGETQVIQAVAVDSLGYPVSSAVRGLRLADTASVQQVDSVTVRSRANGSTEAVFSVAGLPVHLAVAVNQVPTSIVATGGFPKPIVTLPIAAPVPLSCQAFDRNGYATPDQPSVSAIGGTVSGTQCGSLIVNRSGFDTLTVSAGAVQTKVSLVIAAAPIASAVTGTFISLDSFPPEGTAPWAPTLLKDAAGRFELYFTVYSSAPDSTGYTRGDLYRAISSDGINYHLDGPVIRHADAICDPQGQGVENIAIVPRSDGAGWRMFYAAGSNACYGWEVFSAVSTDGVTWSKEPGVRLSNGNTGPKGSPPYPPYPVGEGMWVDALPTGGWRMIVGTQAHVQPPSGTWVVAEWTSQDQLNWTYQGPVVAPSQLPSSGQGAVYSPSIRQIAPGLWRMLFTADNRGTPGSVSQLWSAVSTDLEHWQIEGPVLGAPGTNLYYASLVDDRVVFIRKDQGGSFGIATATVSMP